MEVHSIPKIARYNVPLIPLYAGLILLLSINVFALMVPSARGDPGNAEVSRTRNLQVFEMTPQVHPPGNASVSRLRNMQVFEMTPQVHPPGNASVSRLRNMQVFEMTPQVHPGGDAYISRLRNLQVFEMAYQIHEIKISVTHIATTDQNGNVMSNFTKGDTIQVNFTLHNTGVPFAGALISIVIQDPSDNVVLLGYTFRDFSVGTKANLIFGYKIPSDALAGTYTVKVMVFTDWPSEGGVGLDAKTVSFNLS